jgi:hypothetical protein
MQKMSQDKAATLGLLTLAVSIVTLAIVLVLASNLKESGQLPQAGDREAGEQAAAPTPTGGRVSFAYNDAVELFGDYRFQFVDCHGTPGSISVAKNATIMLDNRDARSRTISLNKKSYTIGAYGFVIVRAPSTSGEYQITCDGGGAAKLVVE